MSAKVHLHMHVSDLAKSKEFYGTFFGATPVKEKPGYVKFLPEWAPVNLALSTGGQLAMLSDEREKKNVKPSHGKASEMLEALRPNEHEYKDPDGPGAAHGRQLGIMAQDLAKTPAGRHVLTAMPGGRMGISIPKATSAAMASLAELHQRVKALEGKKAA